MTKRPRTIWKDEFVQRIYDYAMLGADNKKIAFLLDVPLTALETWIRTRPEVKSSITRGRCDADINVAHSLYHRAIGYEHKSVKIFQYQGQIVKEEYTERFPPDVNAIRMWLMNRQPDMWRDRVAHEINGPTDASLSLKIEWK